MSLTAEQDTQAVNLIRGFAMDAPLAANSGHQGTAMALAPLGHVLYSRVMHHDPADPLWPNRDRFVLSNGHASILQYALLYLNGYGLELDDITAFRQWESRTPGHPEVNHTPGVEVTTGPLGQGFANAVGMALAERVLAGRFGTDAVDHHTYVIAGDGCFMEGVSHEAASLAGHLVLSKLICVYDDNHITIDGDTKLAYSDDVAGRFRAYGWDVAELGEIANDLDALESALRHAQTTDKPSLLILRSHIGYPSPDHTDDHEAHGLAFDAADVTRTKAVMGIPDEPFWAPDELVSACRAAATERGETSRSLWARHNAGVVASPDWIAAWSSTGTAGWVDQLPTSELGEKIPTRKAIESAINATLPYLPGVVAGAADLTGNTGTKLKGETAQSATNHGGRQLYWGVREHAMGSAMNGMALHGGVLPVGGTFFVFADYERPALRLAAISNAKVCFVFTHDSVGVGEDGPTHQPIEQLASLRAIPNLHVVRPADANETAQAWRDVVEHDGPTALILSRQNVEVVTDGSAVTAGAGIVVDADSPQVILLGTGSEVAVCVHAASRLAESGTSVRVVSIPSWDRFEQQDEATRTAILPAGVPVLSVEAATTFGWRRWADASVGIDRFGASAPGSLVLDKLGINVDNVVEQANALLARWRLTERTPR